MVILVCAHAVCSGERASGDSPASRRRPNIILLTVESLRTDHLSSYGYGKPTTPAMERLATGATLYENAYAVTSWTLTSHASLFTGLYPSTHRVRFARDKLDDSYTTLAEQLASAGYQTAGLISGPLLQKQHQLHQGFGLYDESSSNPNGFTSSHADITNPSMERLLFRFLREGRRDGVPFFLFAYLWDPHYYYIPPEPYNKTFVSEGMTPIDCRGCDMATFQKKELAYVISQYDGEILWTDTLLGRLWDELKRLGLWDETAIILTADHGEEFFDHGFKGHRNNLHEETVHVPLIIKLPGQNGARRETRVTSLIDLYPTILEIGGAAVPEGQRGVSLLGASPQQRRIYFELQTEWTRPNAITGAPEYVTNAFRGVRFGEFKFIKEYQGKRRELYSIARDPKETAPVETSAERLAALERELEADFDRMTKDAERWQAAGPAELTPEQEERLRSLGYVTAPKPKQPR